MGQPLPGLQTPAVGFEAPYEMLAACHERLQRSLDLLARLAQHITEHGHDTQTRSAAADVLRYFDLAAPLHHQDEEQHVFPVLRAQGDAALSAQVNRLQDDHRQMASRWAQLRPSLLRWAAPGCTEGVETPTRVAIDAFRQLHARHLQTEEEQVYAAAQTVTSARTLEAMGREMQARRRA